MHNDEPPRMILFLAVLLLTVTLIEWMAFRLVKRRWSQKKGWKTIGVLWLVTTVLLWVSFVICVFNYDTFSIKWPGFVGVSSMAFFVNFFPKLILAAFQVLDDFRYTFQFAAKKITKSDKTIPRATFLNYIGAGFAGVAFSGLLYGVVQGKYDYRVENIKVKLNNLPDAFKGLRIVQISDAHLGSFVGQPKQVLAALQSINDLKPDLILFTGDLVNSSSSEAESWIEAFSNLEAPLGKFSVMGNHDYAEYGEFAPGESEKDVQRLHEIHSEMGFHLMLDEHIKLERDDSQIVLAGVENWSKRAFGQKGDLDKALHGSNSENLTTILMTHDPTHFEECVMDGKAPVDLTLSGHTHGMQVGIKIEFLGINYSPAKLLYKRWGGLYTEGRQLLYVNRGFGVLAFRGRIGMPPEITVLELA
jgi:predicted MPP superfamily phosphohydrolase